MNDTAPNPSLLPDDRDFFSEEEMAAAFAFILDEKEAIAYAHEAYSIPGRGAFFLPNTYNLLSLLSADVADRVRRRLNESPAQEIERMRRFLDSVALRREPYRRYE